MEVKDRFRNSYRVREWVAENVSGLIMLVVVVVVIMLALFGGMLNNGWNAKTDGEKGLYDLEFFKAYETFKAESEKDNTICTTYLEYLLLMDTDREKCNELMPELVKDTVDEKPLEVLEKRINEAHWQERNMKLNTAGVPYPEEQLLLSCAELELCLGQREQDMSYEAAKEIAEKLDALIKTEKKVGFCNDPKSDDEQQEQEKKIEPFLINRVRIHYARAEAYYRLMVLREWQQAGGWEIDEDYKTEEWPVDGLSEKDAARLDVKNVYEELFVSEIKTMLKCYPTLDNENANKDYHQLKNFNMKVSKDVVSKDVVVVVVVKEAKKGLKEKTEKIDLNDDESVKSHINDVKGYFEEEWQTVYFVEINWDDVLVAEEGSSDKAKGLDESDGKKRMMTIAQEWYGRGLYLLGRYYWMKGTQKNSDIHVTDLSAALAIWETAAGMGNGKALEQMSEIYCYGIERYTENGHVTDAMKKYKKHKGYSNRYAKLAAYVYEEAHAYTILARNAKEKSQQKTLDYIKLAIENEDLYAWCLYAKPILGLESKDFQLDTDAWSVDEYKADLENLDLDDFTKYIKAIEENPESTNPSDYTETPINGYAMAHIGDIYEKKGNESSMLSSYKESVKKGCELGAYRMAKHYSDSAQKFKDGDKKKKNLKQARKYIRLADLLADMYHSDVGELEAELNK